MRASLTVRPVAMTKPDNDLIAEVILYSEGFMSAKQLGRMVVSVFTLSAQLLSAQQHSNWGLRALKTRCFDAGGSLVQAGRLQSVCVESKCQHLLLCRRPFLVQLAPAAPASLSPRQPKAELLIKAIRVNTLSKPTFDDASRCVGLLNDVFPVSSERLIKASCESNVHLRRCFVASSGSPVARRYESRSWRQLSAMSWHQGLRAPVRRWSAAQDAAAQGSAHRWTYSAACVAGPSRLRRVHPVARSPGRPRQVRADHRDARHEPQGHAACSPPRRHGQ